MNKFTDFFAHWLDGHVIIKQWLWFIALWLFGLTTVLAITYPIKYLIKCCS